jgi:FtsP/CotA-like multicopper oxidase with cupredoxin domain
MLVFALALIYLTICKGQVRSGPDNPAGYENRCTPGAIPFSEPKMEASVNGSLQVVLYVDIFRYEGAYSFTTRLYNGTFPGPTLVVAPGDKISILLVNNLGADQSTDDFDAFTYHSPNTTSLHLHGLHIDPKNNSDFIFDGVGPGQSKLYEYEIPDNHYPGSHWYHAHYHGSTAFQVMGGLVGALVVQHPQGWIPKEYENLEWYVAVLQIIRADIEKASFLDTSREIGNLVEPDFDNCDVSGLNNLSSSIYVVNGIYQPYVDINVGEYRIFRLIHAIGDDFALELVLSDPQVCSMWTLAKDGVFLESPVEDHVIFLWSGNRADVLISCSEPGNYTLRSNGSSIDNSWFFSIDTKITRVSTDILHFYVHSNGSDSDAEVIHHDKITFPPKPFYLHDLLNFNDSFIAGVYNLEGNFNFLSINGERFSGATNYSYFLDFGKIYEFNLFSDNFSHPMHLHVNHFQIVSVEPYGEDGNYNERWQIDHSDFLWNVGEWRDTIPVVAGYRITIRFRTDTWWGPLIYHCHYLPHADRGMMTVMYINPPEGVYEHLDDLPPNANHSYVPGDFDYQDDGSEYQADTDEFLKESYSSLFDDEEISSLAHESIAEDDSEFVKSPEEVQDSDIEPSA